MNKSTQESIKKAHAAIKAKLAKRTTEQLTLDAIVARAKKHDETHRMLFALTMDTIAERMTESEFEAFESEFDASHQ